MTTVVFVLVIAIVIGVLSVLSFVVGHSACKENSIIHDFNSVTYTC